MAFEHIGIVLLALHLIADFPLQTDWMATNKLGGGPAHLAHVGVHFTLYTIVLVPLYGRWGLLIGTFVAGCHGLIDLRRWVEFDINSGVPSIWADQSLHVGAIALAIVWFS